MEQIKEWLAEFKDKPFKDKLILVLPYILCMFFIARIAELYRLCGGDIFMFLKNITYIVVRQIKRGCSRHIKTV